MDKNKIVVNQVKMYNAGVKPKKGNGLKCCDSLNGGINYPMIWLDSEQAPFLKDKDAGTKVKLVIEGTISSHSLNSDKSSKRESFTVEVNKMGLA